jgi:hypothetical protein
MAPYTPTFTQTDWPPGPLNSDLPKGNSPNDVLHRVEREFGLIATAFDSTSEVGMVVVTSISHGATIPVPAGFTRAETRFFAFIKFYTQRVQAGDFVSFSVFANNNGVVNAGFASGASGNATGVAIARRGGW